MGVYRVFDGTNWVNPCDCDVHVRTHDDAWKLLQPRDCPTRYWDGNTWCIIDCEAPVLSSKTEINIWFDSSGSMAATLPSLNYMRDNLLKDCLIGLYGGSLALYNERVHVIEEPNERSISQLGTLRNADGRAVDTSVNLVLNLVFSDESSPVYWSIPFNPAVQTVDYLADLSATRNAVATEPYTIKGSFFRVFALGSTGTSQRAFVEAMFVDTGLYTPPLNLRDLPLNFNGSLDVEGGFNIYRSTTVYKVSNGIDWTPGVYTCDIISSSGVGAGMTVEITAESVTDGIGSATVSNVGAGYAPSTTISLDVLGGTQGKVLVSTNGSGQISGILAVGTEGKGYVNGNTYTLSAPGGVTIAGEITITSLVSYTAAVYNPNSIIDYGNSSYVYPDVIEGQPPLGIGTTMVPFGISLAGGTPEYYKDEIVTGLNALGIPLVCP